MKASILSSVEIERPSPGLALPEGCKDEHFAIAASAIGHMRRVVAEESPMPSTPLWLRLLQNGQSLRHCSKEWAANVGRLARFFGEGVGYHEKLSAIADPELLYRLGYYDLAIKRLGQMGTDLVTNSLLVRAMSLQGDPNGVVAAALRQDQVRDFSWACLTVQYLVAEKRSGRALQPDDQLLEEVIRHESTLNVANPNRSTFVFLNSLNLLRLGSEPIEMTEKRIKEIIIPLASALPSEQARHVTGNAEFHLALLARHSGDRDCEFTHLEAARELDYGFSDYDYRLAQILHDRKDPAAERFYVSSLANSSFDYALVNDYGCFLNDFDRTSDLASWASLFDALFCEEKNQ